MNLKADIKSLIENSKIDKKLSLKKQYDKIKGAPNRNPKTVTISKIIYKYTFHSSLKKFNEFSSSYTVF